MQNKNIATFKELTNNIDMILFNKAYGYNLELESGVDYDSETTDEPLTIYQYFAINKGDGEYISNITNLPLYYSEELDLYII